MPDRSTKLRVSRAMTSPLAVVFAGAGVAAGLAGGLPIAGIVGLGALGWAVRVAAAVPRATHGDPMDPFTLSMPWRDFVRGAQQAQRRYDEAVARARAGPLRDRLQDIGSRLDDAVRECWKVASAGHVMSDARREIDSAKVQRQLERVTRDPESSPPERESRDATVNALEAQLASAERLERTITDARERLRLLNARMDESVARAVELAVSADQDDLDSLSSDVDGIVGDMEALRQGIAAVDE